MYREAPPSPALAAWVDCYWTRSGRLDGDDRVLPDGCADVIFDVDAASGFVVGTMTTSLVMPAAATPHFFGIRFKPGRASLGIGVPLSEVTDLRAPLREARSIGAGLAARIAEAKTFEERIGLVEVVLTHADMAADPVVDEAVARIHTGSIEAIAERIGVSRQHLARRFAQRVGVSPKMFARIMRFRRVLQSSATDWAGLALQAGYFDQSHLIADFREFAGVSPVPFFLSRRTTAT